MTPTEDFISEAPRPYRREPSALTVGANGSVRHESASETGTVSRWPFMAMVGPSPLPIETTTFGRFGSLATIWNSRPRLPHQSATNAITSRSCPLGLGIATRSLAISTIASRSICSVHRFAGTLLSSPVDARSNAHEARHLGDEDDGAADLDL